MSTQLNEEGQWVNLGAAGLLSAHTPQTVPRDSSQISLCQKPFSSWHWKQHCMRFGSLGSLALFSIVLKHHHQPPLIPQACSTDFQFDAAKAPCWMGCSMALKLFRPELGKNKHTHNHNYVVRPREEPQGQVWYAERSVSLLQRVLVPESQCTSGCLGEALLPAAVSSSTDSCWCWLCSSQSSSRAPIGAS